MIKPKLKILLSVYLFSQIGFYIFAPLYALFAQGLDMEPKDIALLWSYYSLTMAVFILIFGKLENKRKKEKFLAFGMLLFPIADLLFLGVHTQLALAGVLTINALGGGITIPAIKTLFAKNENRGRESEEWSWMDSGNMFSSAIGAGIGGLILSLDGFRGLFLTMAAVQFLAFVLALKSITVRR